MCTTSPRAPLCRARRQSDSPSLPFRAITAPRLRAWSHSGRDVLDPGHVDRDRGEVDEEAPGEHEDECNRGHHAAREAGLQPRTGLNGLQQGSDGTLLLIYVLTVNLHVVLWYARMCMALRAIRTFPGFCAFVITVIMCS